jgi:hypothetical protein
LLLREFVKLRQEQEAEAGAEFTDDLPLPSIPYVCLKKLLGYVIDNTTVAMPANNDTSGLHGRYVVANY